MSLFRGLFLSEKALENDIRREKHFCLLTYYRPFFSSFDTPPLEKSKSNDLFRGYWEGQVVGNEVKRILS